VITRYTDVMNETQTVTTTTTTTAPNGVEVTVHAHPTWTVTSYRKPGALTSKVIAVNPTGKLARHQEKVTDIAMEGVIATMTGAPRPVVNHADMTDELFASIDAIKAAKTRKKKAAA